MTVDALWIRKGSVVAMERDGQIRWNPADYAANSRHQREWALELLEKLHAAPDEIVLDIGCGDGKVTAMLAHEVPKGFVLGIDLSAEMIGYARQTFPREDYPNLRFMRMDASHIRLPRVFDAAFSNACLHWLRDHEAVLEGLHSCLKPGGRLLFQMGGAGNARDMLAAMDEVTRRNHWKAFFRGFVPPYHFYGPTEYGRWLEKTSFRPVRTELIDKDMVHDTMASLAAWLRTTWFPYTDRLSDGHREEFIQDVVDEYLTCHPPDEEGRIHVAMVRLEVEALAVV
ncbi:MAG TPA: methyltransferase domain-containing protein [Deltaproteobacteria bacterium]|nr:methyltransferase domain-containing protein [Deltaproteobacteria bacterium]